MQINVRLFGPLRDKLPIEAKGRTTLKLEEGVTVQAIFDQLELPPNLLITLNNDNEATSESVLSDGDLVVFFAAVSGG